MPRILPLRLSFFGFCAALAVETTAHAAEPGLSARVTVSKGDRPAQVEWASCAAEPCGFERASRLPVDARFDGARATVTRLDTPAGTRLVWIRIPQTTGARAYEVVLAPGQPEALFAGETNPVDDPNATTDRIVRKDLGDGKSLLLHSSAPPGGGVCGLVGAPAAVRAWDGKKWASASLARIDAAARKRAVTLEATPAAASVARRYLHPAGGSDDTFGRGLVDAEPRTAWTEARSGDGAGEYATFQIDKALAVTGFSLLVSPTVPGPGYAPPSSFFVLVEGAVYRIAPPSRPGPLLIELPAPVHTSCVSVVLDEATTTVPAPRTVGIAELGVLAALDDQTPEALATRLGDSARADEALATLLGLGTELGPIWNKVYPALSPERRARVEAAMASRGCNEAAPIAVLALSDKDKDTRERAVHKLEQCRRESVPALTAALDDPDVERAREAGRILALLAPSVAQTELPSRLGREPTRTALWPALGKAFRSADAEQLRAALARAKTAEARLDVVLAMGERGKETGDDARAVIVSALGAPALAMRFRAVEPAVRTHDAALVAKVLADPEASVRHRGLSIMTQLEDAAGFDAPAGAALTDENPRVRGAAAEFFRAHPAGLAAAAPKLFPAADDPWPFVRMAALRAVGGAPAAVKQRALTTVKKRLEDSSFEVRRAALEAMAGMPAEWVREDILARLDDEHEALPVRSQAARTLGSVCSTEDLDRLTTLAQATLAPMAFELEREVGLAAIEALGAIHPADLGKRLAPLRGPKAPATLKGAADRALAAPSRCASKK